MNNKIYTATDFTNYHAGTMPAKAMYALEKAALEDEFLADALEGYAITKNQGDDLATIKTTLESKINRAKVVPMPTSKNKWFRIAAAAAIVLGLGTLFYNLNNKVADNNLAKKVAVPNAKADSLANNQIELAKVKADSAKVSSNIEADNLIDLVPNGNKELVANTLPTNDLAQNSTQAIPLNFNKNSYNYDNNSSAGAAGLNNNSQLNNGIFNYKDADIKKGGPKQLAQNKLNSNTQLNNDLAKNITPAGYEKFKERADSISTFDALSKNDDYRLNETKPAAAPVQKQENKALEEVVVVTSMAAKKRKAETSANTIIASDALNGKVAGVNVAENEIEGRSRKEIAETNSVTTTKQFNLYVFKNIKPVFDGKGNAIKGKVILSFKTNKKGQPVKIKVVQSLSSIADKQAIELIQNYNQWANNKERKNMEVVF